MTGDEFAEKLKEAIRRSVEIHEDSRVEVPDRAGLTKYTITEEEAVRQALNENDLSLKLRNIVRHCKFWYGVKQLEL